MKIIVIGLSLFFDITAGLICRCESTSGYNSLSPKARFDYQAGFKLFEQTAGLESFRFPKKSCLKHDSTCSVYGSKDGREAACYKAITVVDGVDSIIRGCIYASTERIQKCAVRQNSYFCLCNDENDCNIEPERILDLHVPKFTQPPTASEGGSVAPLRNMHHTLQCSCEASSNGASLADTGREGFLRGLLAAEESRGYDMFNIDTQQCQNGADACFIAGSIADTHATCFETKSFLFGKEFIIRGCMHITSHFLKAKCALTKATNFCVCNGTNFCNNGIAETPPPTTIQSTNGQSTEGTTNYDITEAVPHIANDVTDTVDRNELHQDGTSIPKAERHIGSRATELNFELIILFGALSILLFLQFEE